MNTMNFVHIPLIQSLLDLSHISSHFHALFLLLFCVTHWSQLVMWVCAWAWGHALNEISSSQNGSDRQNKRRVWLRMWGKGNLLHCWWECKIRQPHIPKGPISSDTDKCVSMFSATYILYWGIRNSLWVSRDSPNYTSFPIVWYRIKIQFKK